VFDEKMWKGAESDILKEALVAGHGERTFSFHCFD